jgi:hypothetical protein
VARQQGCRVTTYSKRDRERAILGLEVAADHCIAAMANSTIDTEALQDSAMAAGVPERIAHGLVYDAWVRTMTITGNASRFADDCLEAAALLRDGWNPGDPVVPLTPPKRARGRGRGR